MSLPKDIRCTVRCAGAWYLAPVQDSYNNFTVTTLLKRCFPYAPFRISSSGSLLSISIHLTVFRKRIYQYLNTTKI